MRLQFLLTVPEAMRAYRVTEEGVVLALTRVTPVPTGPHHAISDRSEFNFRSRKSRTNPQRIVLLLIERPRQLCGTREGDLGCGLSGSEGSC